MQLRDYQDKSNNNTLNYVIDPTPKKKSGIVVVPTGGGKSLLQGKLVHDYGKPSLILSPSIEILKQNYQKFVAYGGEASIFSASLKSKEISEVTYGSLKSVAGYAKDFKNIGVDLLVIDECLSKSNFVFTPKGKENIKVLVDKFHKGIPQLVYSYNEQLNLIEPKPIINAKYMGSKEVYSVKFSNRKIIESTLNHTLLTNNGWKKVSEISPYDLVMSSSSKYVTGLYNIFNKDQEALIIGTSLGDGSINYRKHNIFRLKCIHGENQKDYLFWKASIFNHLKVEKIQENGYAKNKAYRFTSTCFKLNEKLIDIPTRINHLTLQSLAILWMDDGSLSKLNNAGTLYSLCYSKEYNNLLKLKIESLGIHGVKVCKTVSSSTKKDVWYLRFNKKAVENLSKLCAKYIHKNLDYKVTPEFRFEVGSYQWDSNFLGYGSNIISITKKGVEETFEIEVKDNHSYILAGTCKQSRVKHGLISHNCHLHTDASSGLMKNFIRQLSPKRIVGFTATPFRLTSEAGPSGFPEASLSMLTSTFPKLFDDYIHITQIKELIDKGFWADIDIETHPFDTSGLVFTSTGSDYNEESISRAVKDQQVNNRIYKRTKQLMQEKNSILMFLDSVENCEIMANALGDKAAVVSGKTKVKDREKILNQFKSGEIQVVCCHSTLVVGFDFPELECVIMGRPTNSLAIFYQIYGRLVRPFENKTGLFLDFGGNISKFGEMHHVTIDNYRGIGHEVFYKDRMVSGVPLSGPPVTLEYLDNMVEKRLTTMNAMQPDLNHIMTFGKYKGQIITKVPKFYLEWLLSSNLPLDTSLKVTVHHILQKPTSLY